MEVQRELLKYGLKYLTSLLWYMNPLELQDHQDAGRDQNHSADTKLGLLSEDQCYKTHSCLPECIALYKNYAVPRLKLGS